MMAGTENRVARVSLGIMLIIVLSSGVWALGIAPARVSYDFEPGMKKTATLRILNTEQRDMMVALSVAGELARYITLNQTMVMVPKGREWQVAYTFQLPSGLGRPGSHTAEIVATEVPGLSGGTTAITAVVGVASQLVINVPYPGKYLEARLFTPGGDAGKPVEFTASLHNLGTEDLQRIDGMVEILGPAGDRIAEVGFGAISLASKQTGKITALAERLKPGAYYATATLGYDGERLGLGQNFTIGKPHIGIVGIAVGESLPGDIARFDIELENGWNTEIGDAYGDLALLGKEGVPIAATRTESIGIAPAERRTLVAYLPTQGVDAGTYDLELAIRYAGLETRQQEEIYIGRRGIFFTDRPPPFLRQNATLIALIGALIALNTAWYLYIRKRAKLK